MSMEFRGGAKAGAERAVGGGAANADVSDMPAGTDGYALRVMKSEMK